LTADERVNLEELTKKGKSPAYKINHARILVKADTNIIYQIVTAKHGGKLNIRSQLGSGTEFEILLPLV
jgi:hypothetical protein